MLSTVLLGLSASVSLFWWGAAWNSGILQQVWTRATRPWVLGLAVVQLAAWLVMVLTVVRTRRVSSSVVQGTVSLLTAGVLVGNLLYLVTPFLGLLIAGPFLAALVVVLAVEGGLRPTRGPVSGDRAA